MYVHCVLTQYQYILTSTRVCVCVSVGGVREAGPGEDKQDIINEAGKQEIALTLTNKYESLAKDDSSDMKALFVRYNQFCAL